MGGILTKKKIDSTEKKVGYNTADLAVKTLSNIRNQVKHSVADILSNSDFISRSIGMNNSYNDIMFLVQLLGREPITLFGKNYAYIYDHVRRNYLQGTKIGKGDNCPKFTFYKDPPTIRFADPYNDSMNMSDRWIHSFEMLDTAISETTLHYSESNDGKTNNKFIDNKNDLEYSNPGTAHGSIKSYVPFIDKCDMIGKTNANFAHGKYETLIARFHTNSEDSKSQSDPTQSANTKKYGQSHGRNLLKEKQDDIVNGYDNPYCRVWTYHHQYNQIKRQIRPFNENTAESLINAMGNTSFRRLGDDEFGSAGNRLDNYGTLNYKNNLPIIAPTAKIKDYFEHKENDMERQTFSTKRCMFSIENLAWRDIKAKTDEYDEYGLSPEQRGPLGGRIMWFPPYDLKFSENVRVDWNNNKFIGRGEKVYTYTDTERTGNLSFTMIIDHPSILDYWSRLDSKGKKLADGNSGGVENVENQEQTLLRFFAGCSILTAAPQEYRTRNKILNNIEQITTSNITNDSEGVKNTVTKKMYCMLYFPNNYSGKDDDVNFAINYLMYGIGTQQTASKVNNKWVMNSASTNSIEEGIGYEMSDRGISMVKWDDISDIIKYGVKLDNLDFVEGDIEAISGGNNLYHVKQIGKTADKGEDSTELTSEWKYKRWYYRVDETNDNLKNDKRVPEQRLIDRPFNYIDGNSYKLNSTGYKWTAENIKEIGITDNDDLVSFADMYVALTDGASSIPHDNEKVKQIKDMKEKQNGYKIVKVSFLGLNSSHGSNPKEDVNTSRNYSLARNRGLTFRKWLIDKEFPMADKSDEEIEIKGQNKSSETKDENGINPNSVDNHYEKAWRSAYVVIEYEKSDVSNASSAEPTKVDENGQQQVDRVGIKNKNTSYSNILTPYDWLYKTTEGQSVLTSNPQLYQKGYAVSWVDIKEITGIDYKKKYFDQYNWDYDDTYLQQGITIKKGIVRRYDNEGEFFKTLTSDAPFLHHLISEKIKYFDPAFHSISPEGFNARLTFLHQCTRQGSTVENNATDVSTSYNLSFGRPPVCVLRIGDFYYTKIIINSLDIQYETPQWDLNPEGIGVMPMFANITINFAFIGGSDLSGPIARLQNAVSFNYYANTSVYDNRAEMVEYENNGSGKEVKFRGWNYPSDKSSKK